MVSQGGAVFGRSVLHRLLCPALAVGVVLLAGTPLLAQLPGTPPPPAKFPTGDSVPAQPVRQAALVVQPDQAAGPTVPAAGKGQAAPPLRLPATCPANRLPWSWRRMS